MIVLYILLAVLAVLALQGVGWANATLAIVTLISVSMNLWAWMNE